MSEALKTKVKWVWEDTINHGNLDALDEVIGPNYVRHQPPFPDMVGPAALKTYLADSRTAYHDCHFTIAKIISEGGWTALRWTLAGTQTGVSPTTGAPPSGKHATMNGCTMSRIEGGKLVEEWVLGDFLASCNSWAWSRS